MVDIALADSGTMPGASSNTLATRRRIAQALLQQGADTSPVGHWTQGLGRVTQALVGGWLGGSAEQEERARDARLSGVVQALIAGDTGTTAPTAPPVAGGPRPTSRGGPPGSFPDFVMQQEGFSPRAYSDYGQTSIGYGTRAMPGETAITEDAARMRMYAELGQARDRVRAMGVQMTPGQEDALTDLTYNAGPGWMTQGLGQAVRRGDWTAATTLFQQYVNAGGQPLEGLRRRRGGASPWLTGPGIEGGIDPGGVQTPIPGATPASGAQPAPGAPTPTPGAGGPQTAPPGAAAAGAGAQPPPAPGGLQLSPQARAAVAAMAQSNPQAALQMVLQVMLRGDQPTELQRNYAAYVVDQTRRNLPVQSMDEWDLARRRAGATAITTQQMGERAFESEAGKRLATQYTEMVQAGRDARNYSAMLGMLAELGPQIGTGLPAQIMSRLGPIAEALGVRVEGLGSMQAYQAIVNQLAPRMRVAGSGATSDFEMRQYLQSLPTLMNTPEGNAMITQVNQAIAQSQIAAAEIASQALEGSITRQEAERRLRALPNPLQAWLDSRPGRRPTTQTPPGGGDGFSIQRLE